VAGQDRSAAATPSADVATPTAVAPLMLAVMPTGRCWVRVTADGRVRLSREVTAGERVDIDATERLDLVVGDAGAFGYRINGRPGRPLGLAGQVARATIAPGSVASFQSSVIGH
jgi:hypothetical protein